MAKKFNFDRVARDVLARNNKKKDTQKREPVLGERAKQAEKPVVQASRNEQFSLIKSVNLRNRQTLIDKAINPTLRMAKQIGLKSAKMKLLSTELYKLLETNSNLSIGQFYNLCTQEIKEFMESKKTEALSIKKRTELIRKKIEEKLKIGDLRAKLAKIKPNIGTLEELKTESEFEENKNGSGKIKSSLNKYKPLKTLFRLVSRESGVPEKELLAFISIESLFDPKAKTGSSLGLGQLQKRATVASIMKLNKNLSQREATRLALEIRNTGLIKDSLINLRLTAEYWKIAKRQVINSGFKNAKISMVYTYYNQGLGSAKRVIKGGHPEGKNPWYWENVKLFSKMPWGDFEVR